jgi:hypothetical protein
MSGMPVWACLRVLEAGAGEAAGFTGFLIAPDGP